MNTETTVFIFALMALVGIVSVVVVETFTIMLQVQAAGNPHSGCRVYSMGYNASHGKC